MRLAETQTLWSSGCGCCRVTRRGFLAGCAGCAVTAGTLLDARSIWGASAAGARPKVRVVFCAARPDGPTWPNIGYDFAGRQREVLQALRNGCPDLEFLPAEVIEQTAEQSGLLARDNEVDGYIVCLLGLGWQCEFLGYCQTGKPTLIVDNLFGGSGMFLTRLGQAVTSAPAVDWVSSSSDTDLVASARSFAMLSQGRSATDVAAAFRQARRERCPAVSDWSCREDRVTTVDFKDAMEELKRTKVLVVGGGWGGDEFRRAAQEVMGVTFVPIDFPELSAAYAAADVDSAKEYAARWTAGAQAVVEPSSDDLAGAAQMHVAMEDVMRKHGATGISINCLGGFYGGHLKAYPCLGFTQLNNDGKIGGCEADQMSALTMAVMGVLVKRPGYISDPVIDTAKNQIIYAHCVAMTKPFGTDGPANPYRVRNHSEDRRGASIQSLLPADYLTTTLEINPVTRQVLMHQAKTVGNNPSDMACRTKLEANVKGDIEKLTENWRMGWHRVTFYGDLSDSVAEMCDRYKLELIAEA